MLDCGWQSMHAVSKYVKISKNKYETNELIKCFGAMPLSYVEQMKLIGINKLQHQVRNITVTYSLPEVTINLKCRLEMFVFITGLCTMKIGKIQKNSKRSKSYHILYTAN